RPLGALFYSKALNHKDVSYLNISARATAKPFLDFHGFTKYVSGQFLAFPLLSSTPAPEEASVTVIDRGSSSVLEGISESKRELLLTHAEYGCLCVVCQTPGRAYPFIFQHRWFKGFLPGVQLIYAPSIQDFVQFAKPIGRMLAKRGRLFVRVDANGRILGLTGKYFAGMEERYYKGVRPRIGDLSYTQTVMAPFIR